MSDQIIKDIGRKCGDDVSAAIRRNMLLMADQRGAMIVATYAAAAAIGAASGAFAAFLNGPAEIDAATIDEMWTEILRPMVLGQNAGGSAHV